MADITFIGEINEYSSTDFVNIIDAIPARATRTMFLATPGGDVFAGGAMIIAMEHAIERGVHFEIELGSIVASMGAAMTAAAKARKCRVVAHANTEVMFHGCWTIAAGGASILKDEAKGLEDFNATVKKDLAAIGIADTDEWFAEGREKWLNADELVELGLADEIVSRPAGVDDRARDLAERFAAKLNTKETHMEDTHDEVTTVEETPAEVVAETPAEEVVETPAAETEAATVPEAEAPAETETPADEPAPATVEDMVSRADFRAMQSTADKKISDLQKSLNEAQTRITGLTKERDTLAKELADLRDTSAKTIEELKQAHNEVVAPALAHTEPQPKTAKEIGEARMSAADKCNALLLKS